MRKRTGIAILLIALLTGATAAFGMDLPTGRWWNDPILAQKLNLTNEEKVLLDHKFVDARRKMIQIKGDMDAQRFELETALERDPFDEAGVMEQFRRLEDQRSHLIREGFNFVLETRRILGVERFCQLKAIHDQARAKRGPKREGREMLK